MSPLVWVGSLFVIWRITLLIIADIAPKFIAVFGDKFPYRIAVLQNLYYEKWFWVWGNFDGVHYLRIAKDGYAAQFSQSFFPLYPFLVGILGRILNNEYVISGFIISNFSFLLALFFLFKLLEINFGKSLAQKTIIYLLIFPTSFFFGAIYTESLFLLLIVLTFYFAQKGNYLKAGIFGYFACLTRFVGIFLLPALIFEYYFTNRKKITFAYLIEIITKFRWLFLMPLGLITYMIYLTLNFSNPLYFISALPSFGTGRTTSEIILPPQVIWRYLKIIFTTDPQSLAFVNAGFELTATIGFLILLFLSFSKVKFSWFLFSLLSIVTPTLTGTLTSMPRYVLIAIPAFVILAKVKNQLIIFIIVIAFLVALVFSTTVFTSGYWLA